MAQKSLNEKKSVGIQLTLPPKHESDKTFIRWLTTLQQSGCDHVELNVPYPEEVKAKKIESFLSDFGLRCTNFASGGLYPNKVTSLSHSDEKVRSESIESIAKAIRFSADANFKGLILGFAQGRHTKERSLARELFSDSLEKLVDVAKESNIIIVVEAVNSFISNVCNTIEDTVALVEKFPKEQFAILPDTYHMNIEEADMALPLIKHVSWFKSIHFSENNRYFPGLGAVDFQQVYRALEFANFKGTLTIEGNVKSDFENELTASVALIKNLEVLENLYNR